jgi:hypothetical protein
MPVNRRGSCLRSAEGGAHGFVEIGLHADGLRVHVVPEVVALGEAVLVRPDGYVAWRGQPDGVAAAFAAAITGEPR